MYGTFGGKEPAHQTYSDKNLENAKVWRAVVEGSSILLKDCDKCANQYLGRGNFGHSYVTNNRTPKTTRTLRAFRAMPADTWTPIKPIPRYSSQLVTHAILDGNPLSFETYRSFWKDVFEENPPLLILKSDQLNNIIAHENALELHVREFAEGKRLLVARNGKIRVLVNPLKCDWGHYSNVTSDSNEKRKRECELLDYYSSWQKFALEEIRRDL